MYGGDCATMLVTSGFAGDQHTDSTAVPKRNTSPHAARQGNGLSSGPAGRFAESAASLR